MPSNHLTLWHPLLLPPSIFPRIRVFSNESVLSIRWPKYCSFSFNISTFNEYSVLISFRMDWLDLLAVQGTLKSLLQHHSSKASILRCPRFTTTFKLTVLFHEPFPVFPYETKEHVRMQTRKLDSFLSAHKRSQCPTTSISERSPECLLPFILIVIVPVQVLLFFCPCWQNRLLSYFTIVANGA